MWGSVECTDFISDDKARVPREVSEGELIAHLRLWLHMAVALGVASPVHLAVHLPNAGPVVSQGPADGL